MITRHFPFFLAAAEEQSFHRAAERLNIAQSALSRHIGDLERELGGVRLFERLTRGIRLTEIGRAYLDDVRRILAEIDAAQERARRFAGGELGRLRVSFTEGLAANPLLPRALRRFREAYPEVDVKFLPLVSEAQRAGLQIDEIDVGFVYEESSDAQDFALQRIAIDHLMLAVPARHRLAAQAKIHLADLRGEPMIWPARQQSPRLFDRMIAVAAAGDFSPRIAVEVTSADIGCTLASAGFGLALVISAARAHTDVVLRAIEDFEVEMPLSMIWRRDETNPVLANFRACVQAETAS